MAKSRLRSGAIAGVGNSGKRGGARVEVRSADRGDGAGDPLSG